MENTTEYSLETKHRLVEELPAGINYPEYRELVTELTTKGQSSSPVQSESNSKYTRLNDARMRRWDKTIRVSPEIEERFRNFKGDQTWLVITESWCGDAAHSIPVMNKLSELSDGISLKLVFRDTHPELMEAFLTNGTRSIPKLIAIDNESGKIANVWGPRPSMVTEMAEASKREFGRLTPEFKQDLQTWYNKDKGQNIIADLTKFLD